MALPVTFSLRSLLGSRYIDAVISASAALGIESRTVLEEIADTSVDCFPADFAAWQDSQLPNVGKTVVPPLDASSPGAGTAAFDGALQRGSAPLAARGCYRIGENGILALTGTSEHYQTSLGHAFPGFKLLELATRLGIPNATHNNTRGHITRLLERELIRVANGIAPGDENALAAVLSSKSPGVLNRVINLETGSLACEAAFKMMLARFYKLHVSSPAPLYSGRIPVFLVMEDHTGGREANYHGTTILPQTFRGMWPELAAKQEAADALKVVSVKINDFDDFASKVARWDHGKYKVAGFTHELVLMNYGGIALTEDFVQKTGRLAREHDIPVFIDEIQSCLWSPELFMFREYGAKPDFVSVGKGFPAGAYPASKILASAAMDNLDLFGALVTNGQEEVASLATLIALKFAEAWSPHTAALASLWEKGMRALAERHSGKVVCAEGRGLLSAAVFRSAEAAKIFASQLVHNCAIDCSAQTYKADCPPAALLKPPVTASPAILEYILQKMDAVLQEIRL